VRGSRSIELTRLKKKEERKHLPHFASSWFGTFVMLSHTTGSLVGHENTQKGMVRCYKVKGV